MNAFQNSQVLANETLMAFENNLSAGRLVSHEWDDRFAKSGAKIGDSIDLRDPVRFTLGEGDAVIPQSITENTRRLTLNRMPNVAYSWTTRDETLTVDQWMKRYGEPATIRIANEIDVSILTLGYQCTGHYVGTCATAVAAMRTFGDARAKLFDYAAPPKKEYSIILPPSMEVDAVALAQGLFNSQPQIKRQYEDGSMGRANGLNWEVDQNVRRHTVGPLGNVPLVDGANQTGSFILTKGWTAAAASRLKKGDSITFAGVNGVNPITKDDLGYLEQFTVTQDFSSDGGGGGNVYISPPIITSGPYQTVTASPADAAIILIFGHASSHAGQITSNALVLHPDALTIGMAPLFLPKDIHWGAVAKNEDTGCAIRIWRASDIKSGELITRIDALFGCAALHPEWVVRILGA